MERRKIVDNKWVTLIEDSFKLPNGTDCTYYHVQKSDAVLTIAIDDQQSDLHTFIVNQNRHPIGKTIWQFPIGGFNSSNENPKDAGRKELQEETGVLAGEIEYLGSFYADPGFTNQKLHVCATKDIVEIGDQKLERLEHGLISKRVATSEIESLIENGDMGDAWGLAGHYYLNKYLKSI